MQRLALAILLSLPMICSAQLSGQFQFAFKNDLPLWDVTGEYAQEGDDFEISATFQHSLRGEVFGTSTARLREGFTDVSAQQTIAGRVRGTSGSVVSMVASGTGQFRGRALGRDISGPFKGTLSLAVDNVTRTMNGTLAGEFCVRGLGCRTLATNISLALPENMTGAWQFNLDLTTSNNVVRGNATVVLSSGRAIQFNARGKYRTATGETVVRLNGKGGARGLRLLVTLDAKGALQSIRGKLLGQKIAYDADAI